MVKINDYQIDRGNVLFLHGAQVANVIAAAQNPTENLGMQSFYSAIHHLRKVGQLGDFNRVDTWLSKCLRVPPYCIY